MQNGVSVRSTVQALADVVEVPLAAASGSALIGFQPLGTGAVATTTQAKLRQEYNVFDVFTAAEIADTLLALPTIDTTAKLQQAIDNALALGQKVVAYGNFRTSSKIAIKGGCDFSQATFHVYSTPAVAVELSTGNGTNPTDILYLTVETEVILPSIINKTKPGIGWVGQGIGIRYVNVQNIKITERLVENFAVGVLHTSYTQGSGYCTVQGGYLRNNKVNRQFSIGDALGAFTNRWDLFGGRYFHLSAEGIEVPGVIHIDIDAPAAGNILNDLNFFGGSLEGNAQQYHVRCGGTAVTIYGMRWESTSPGGNKLHLAYNGLSGQGSCNVILGRGVGEPSINITNDAGAAGRVYIQGDGNGGLIVAPNPAYTLQNKQSSSDPILSGYEAATDAFISDPLVNYALFLGAQKLAGKRAADTGDRVQLDSVNGRVYLGSGTGAPTQYFGRVGTAGIGPIGTGLSMTEGIAVPGNVTGFSTIYVDVADLEPKIKFANNQVRSFFVEDTATAAAIIAIGNAINTTNKYTGKKVWDSTNNRMMRASGTTAGSVWWVVDGSVSITPV